MREHASIRRTSGRPLRAALLVAALGLLSVAAPAGATNGIVCTTGPSFDLVAKPGYIETPDGNTVYMWGFANSAAGGAFQMPGPNLCVNAGDTVTVHLRNALTGPSAAPVSIVFPGQSGVSATGGGAGLFTREAPVGGDVTYTFTASEPGTYLYESGTDQQKQIEMGLYGALIVRPAPCAATTCNAYGGTGTTFDPRREYLIVLGEVDPDLHRAVLNGQPYDRGKLRNRYFTVNGRSFPDTLQSNNVSLLPSQPYGALVRLKPYDPVLNPNPALIRMVNAGLANHPFHPHGNHLRMIAQDGRRFLTPSGADASTEHFGETIASGSTEDFLLTWNPDPTDPNSPSQPFPSSVPIPSYRNLLFKDNNTWYSGSPYLGYKGTLPTGVTSQNVCGEFYFPWHSHALEEFVNWDVPFGGMATLLRVDPLVGCTSYPTSVKIQAGTLRSGGYAALGADDNSYYQVNSTTTTPPALRTDWYGGFTGVPTGSSNLAVTYIGKNSTTGISQQLAVWKWTTPQGWVTFGGSSPVGVAETPLTATPPGAASQYIGTGSYKGQVRVQVVSTRTAGSGTFFTSGELMKITYDAP
jgi:hypothetical protein